VKDLGGEVETVRPDDCADFEIDAYRGGHWDHPLPKKAGSVKETRERNRPVVGTCA
jgi:hypothetical protein